MLRFLFYFLESTANDMLVDVHFQMPRNNLIQRLDLI